MAEIENNLDTDEIESHLHEIEALLEREKSLNETRQDRPRHELLDNIGYEEALVALERKLAALGATELVSILEVLAEEDRRIVWGALEAGRREEVSRNLSATTRAGLSGRQGGANLRKMLNAFELQGGRLRQIPMDSREELAQANPIWIDLVAPSEEVRQLIEEVFDLSLPIPEEHTDLEVSARFYVEEDGSIYLHSNFLLDKINESRNVPVAFILHRNILFSVRNEELPVFRLQRLRVRTQIGIVSDCLDVLLGLYSADVEYSADALEDIYAALEAVSAQVLSRQMTDSEAAKVLAVIASEEDLNGCIRRNALDTRRAVSFLMRGRFLSASQINDSQQLLRDIESLDGHTSFLFEKINFLMNATVGFININQNKVIRIFSVASVAMLPPTLIASVYGMNFKYMPELDWSLGYPFAISLMMLSVVLPFWWFRRKGWL
ncbi:Magnesium and cobalt transport protein CorA [Sterolibacterium denitrificans]|uniref:Magnesium transport protein CorA n=1 Tax=Sterolibacterium denitrificans TaxID=157592 RepID=A0A7Z7MVR6_9PROT|nr:magnesium/cobalt transporter CorA [Sterolibacterium denitrificans]SMB26813.1 Magnesium and cobalt transport protein CorA [Sterolibacterium denitrificans]